MRGIPSPDEPRNAQFYREVREVILREIVKQLHLLKRTGIPAPTPQAVAMQYKEFEAAMQQTPPGSLSNAIQRAVLALPPTITPTPTPTPGSVLANLIAGGVLPADYRAQLVANQPPPPQPALIAGPIIAWRLWKIRQDGILLSVAQNCAWPTGAPIEGIHESGTQWAAPWKRRVGPGNTSGIYAMKTREHLVGQEYGRDCLVGQVALWGKVIEHEKGYRAEFAYPVMVDLEVKSPMPGFPRPKRRSDLARMIRENYGCEVRE